MVRIMDQFARLVVMVACLAFLAWYALATAAVLLPILTRRGN